MNFESSERRSKSSIGLTPLIDVVFILLLFFMLASNFSEERTLSVTSQPSAKTLSPTEVETIRIHVVEAEQYVMNGYPFEPDTLIEELVKQNRAMPSASISLSVQTGVSVQALMDLMTHARKSGFNNFSMSGGTLP